MNAVLITGADGHVGRALARRLLEVSDGTLLLYVRAADAGERRAKRQKLGSLALNPRCRIVFGDLRERAPFTSVNPDEVTGILHCAAAIDFAVDRPTATAINIEGTEKALAFAGRCSRLRRFGLVSTLYAAGLRDGLIAEAPFDEARAYANHYEWSKWRAECLVLQRTQLPWQIYRLATLIGENGDGIVVQHNAIHNTLRLLYYGLLSVLPGNAATRVYLATTEFIASAIGGLFLRGDERGIFHLSDAGNDALTLGKLADIAYEAFLAEPAFARRQILKPLFCDHESFAALVDAAGRFGVPVSQALQSVAPFARQLYSNKDVQTARTCRALGQRRDHDPQRLAAAVARYLVRTRWGLRLPAGSESRHHD
jgi:nucleoside-diphosphate-sugar epimerase